MTVKAFDVLFGADDDSRVENLKTFEEAEAFIIAHVKKTHANWLLASCRDPETAKEFERKRYVIYHTEGKVVADDVLTKMSFKELCDAAFEWRVLSAFEFKFYNK